MPHVPSGATRQPPSQVQAVVVDLLMATMDSLAVWRAAAGELGTPWRDAVTDRMRAAGRYRPYEALVADEAARLDLPPTATKVLFKLWERMQPRPDAVALRRLGRPWGFLSNCSATLARAAAERASLDPRFTLSAEECGWYKPHPAAYLAASSRLRVEPAETLLVAGSAYDAEGARVAGLQAVLVRRRGDEPDPGPSIAVIASLEDLVAGLEDQLASG